MVIDSALRRSDNKDMTTSETTTSQPEATWYVVSWKNRNGRRSAAYPGIDLQFAKDYKAALIDPAGVQIRKFATREDAFRFYYKAQY